jgi:hypothetical protein
MAWTNHPGYTNGCTFPANHRTDQWVPRLGRARAPDIDTTDPEALQTQHTRSHSPPQAVGGGRAPMQPNMSPAPATAYDRNNASDTMSPPGDSSSNAKRKSEDASAQPRAKRNRYISIAWYVWHADMHPPLGIMAKRKQQRVQAPQDQVQRAITMSALRQSQPRMHVCAQLLQQLQGVRVSGPGCLSTWRTRLTCDAASSSKCRRISRRFSSKSMTSTTTSLPSGRRWMYRVTTPAQSAHLSTAETFSNPRCCLLCLPDREPNPSASTHASMAQHRALSISAWPGRA